MDGHRADIVILKTARAHAAYEGRLSVNERDVLLAAELALPHRMKKQPFQDAVLDMQNLADRLKQSRSEQASLQEAQQGPQAQDGDSLSAVKKKT